MHYRIVLPPHPGASLILTQTLDWLKQDSAMQADRAKLSKACCAPSDYALLEGAPLPIPLQEASCEAC